MKKILTGILASFMAVNPALAIADANKGGQEQNPGAAFFSLFPERVPISYGFLQPFRESAAYKDYLKRPKSELSKLIYLANRLRKTDFTVIYKGHEYKVHYLAEAATRYINCNYKNETAEDWIKTHAYRAPSDGSLIYLKSPDGNFRLARDIFIEELNSLPRD